VGPFLRRWWWLLLLLVLLLVGGGTAAVVVKRRRGRALLTYTVGPDGRVKESIPSLVVAASKLLGREVSVDELLLASELASEEGSKPRIVKVAVAWATRNKARREGKNLVQLIAADGKLGRQGITGHGYASTRQPPTAEDFEIAHAVLAGLEPDPTHGAVQFDSPKAQRAAVAKGIAKYDKSPEQVAAARMREGKRMVTLPGIAADDLRFWRPIA
jgi:hypothetical protein